VDIMCAVKGIETPTSRRWRLRARARSSAWHPSSSRLETVIMPQALNCQQGRRVIAHASQQLPGAGAQ